MKTRLRRLITLMGVIGLSTAFASAHAAVIQYEFQASVTSGAGPFGVGTTLSATFGYDPSTLPDSQNVDGADISPAFASYGLFSVYPGAITDFSASIQGNGFALNAGVVRVGDGNGDMLSGIFAGGGPLSPGWSGLTVGEFELVQFSLFTAGFAAMLADQALLPEFPYFADIANGVNTGMNLTFVNAAGERFVQNLWASAGGEVSLRRVPEPAAWTLLGTGLLLLGLARRKRGA